MPDPKDAVAPAKEFQDLMVAAKKAPHYFVMMKTKEGVAIEAHKNKQPDQLEAPCKRKGGQGPMVKGVMTADAKYFYLQAWSDDVPPGLPRQARRYFKELGLKARLEVSLPSGALLGDGDEEDEEEGAAPGQPQQEEAPDAKAVLTARLKAVAPQVRAATEQALAGADKLAAAVKAAAAEIAAGGLDRAGALVEAVERGLTSLGTAAQADPAALRQQLKSDFDGLRGDLEAALQVAGPVGAKIGTVAKMFATELDRDLKKAGQALAMLKQLLAAAAKARPEPKGIVGDALAAAGALLGEAKDRAGQAIDAAAGEARERLAQAGEAIGAAVDEAREFVADRLEDFATEAGLEDELAMLRELDVPRDERARLLQEWKADPAKAKDYETKLMDDAKVPADRRAALEKLRAQSPAAFAASLKALGDIGEVDTSPDALQEAVEEAEAARQALQARLEAETTARAALAVASAQVQAAGATTTAARQAAAAAATAIGDLIARTGDPAALPEAERKAFEAELAAAKAASDAAARALAEAEAAEAKAREDEAQARGTADAAAGETKTAREAHGKAAAEQEKGDARRALLDAVSFGPLAADAKPALADADKAAMMGVFAKDSALAGQAMGLLKTAADPGALARGAAMTADKFADGFADDKGNRLDASDEDRREMAANALRLGAERGDGYFRGFEDYLKSGKQLQPDPYGGMAEPLDDPEAETQRRNAIALGRTRGLAAAAVQPDGTVDFGTDGAAAAMDHMLFHPGSLKSFTPQMTAKMEETQSLFSDPATGARAQQTIKDTRLPTAGDVTDRTASRALVAGTTGKDKAAVTDNDARAAVLGAMMTPLSQGPVGSCFSTAPVRAIRETDPLRAMDEYSKIASTGQFKAADGAIYPANTRLPAGENPLMRSWEYSVATAAAEEAASIERANLEGGLWGAAGPGKGLGDIRGIVGDAAWANTMDPVNGAVPGVEQKLRDAIAKDLKFEYNAGPAVGMAGGGGDGRSTDGAYQIFHKRSAITTEAGFVAALKEIALGAAGFAEGTPEGDAIVALVSSQDFIDSVVASGGADGYKPWELEGGGFEWQTKKALDGGNPDLHDMTPADPGPPVPTEAERTVAVLKGLIDKHGAMTTDLSLVATRGDDCNHAFSALPKHPSMDKIRDPDSDRKIDDELVAPGRAMAARKLPVEQAARMYEEQLKGFMKGRPGDERDLIVAALKNRPTVEMNPGELKAKVTAELGALRDAVAQRRLDVWFDTENAERKAKGQPEMLPGEKAGYLQWFKDDEEAGLARTIDAKLMQDLAPPEVVIADSNWGGPEGQSYFVAAPHPVTGELMIWEKKMPGGEMSPMGKNWAEASWQEIH